jgi:hypothetical protein
VGYRIFQVPSVHASATVARVGTSGASVGSLLLVRAFSACDGVIRRYSQQCLIRCPRLWVAAYSLHSPKYPTFRGVDFRLLAAYNRTDVLLTQIHLRSSCLLRTLPNAHPVRADSANLAGVAGPSFERGRESRTNEDRTGNLACDWQWSHFNISRGGEGSCIRTTTSVVISSRRASRMAEKPRVKPQQTEAETDAALARAYALLIQAGERAAEAGLYIA